MKLRQHDEVADLISRGKLHEAIDLGIQAQLVTPMTAALVLEPNAVYSTRTDLNYSQHGQLPCQPGLDGAVDWAISSYWLNFTSGIVSNLNNLSSAAGSAGYSSPVSIPLEHFSSSQTANNEGIASAQYPSALHSSKIVQTGNYMSALSGDYSGSLINTDESKDAVCEPALHQWLRPMLCGLTLLYGSFVLFTLLFPEGRIFTAGSGKLKKMMVLSTAALVTGAILMICLHAIPAISDLICLWC